MSWQSYLETAVSLLNASGIPSSLEIINSIKKVNPTRLGLSESERELGYEVKSRLQNLLLENYGAAFYLEPDPLSPDIVLVKHTALPIDACHAQLKFLSPSALDAVGGPPVQSNREKRASSLRPGKKSNPAQSEPAAALQKARQLIDQYDYPQAEEVLSAIRITSTTEIPLLEEAVGIMMEQLGAYGRAAETIVAHPRQILREKKIREMLGLSYYRNAMLPEARSVFEPLHPRDLGKESLLAVADISLKDGKLRHAFDVLQLAEKMEGYLPDQERVKDGIEQKMLEEAEPVLKLALAALDEAAVERALALARQALEQYPNFDKAREVASRTEKLLAGSEIDALWKKLEMATGHEERLDLLAQLLERDRDNREGIAELVAREKALMRRQTLASRLVELGRLARDEAWADCFGILRWIFTLEDCVEQQSAASISEHFTVLHRNDRLLRLSERSAREIWLEYVELTTALHAGHWEGRLPQWNHIKPYFQSYQTFRDGMQRVLALEQERARAALREALKEAADESCTFSRAKALLNGVRSLLPLLPAGEQSRFRVSMDEHLARLTPKESDEPLIQEYLEARLIGHNEKAERLREEVSDGDALAEADAELAEFLQIESSPVTVQINDALPFDLESPAPSFFWLGGRGRYLVFQEEGVATLIVDLEEMSAVRVKNDSIEDALFSDCLPDANTLLFVNVAQRRALRIEASGGKATVAADIDLPSRFDLDDDEAVVFLFMAGEDPTEYFAHIIDINGTRPAKVVGRKLSNWNKTSQEIRIRREPWLKMWRLSYAPDRFVIGAADETRICSKTLRTERNLIMEPNLWMVDPIRGRICWYDGKVLRDLDTEFQDCEDLPNSFGAVLLNDHRITSVNPVTHSALARFRQRCAIFDFGKNRFSQSFSFGRVFSNDGRWYYYDYRDEERELILRDVTDELGSMLEWVELKPLRKDNEKDYQEFLNVLFFGYDIHGSQDSGDGSSSAMQEEDAH